MEERGDVMTDNQYYGILKMILAILRRCKNLEEAIVEIINLLKGDKSFLDEPDKERPEG